jgi:hypothetical protein
MSSILKYCTIQQPAAVGGADAKNDGLSLQETEQLLSSLGASGSRTLAHFMLVPALHFVKSWDASILDGTKALKAIARSGLVRV